MEWAMGDIFHTAITMTPWDDQGLFSQYHLLKKDSFSRRLFLSC